MDVKMYGSLILKKIKNYFIIIGSFKMECTKMTIKGFVNYNNGKMPFVLEKYNLELFSDNELIKNFLKEYNSKNNYILTGQYFRMGTTPENITLLIDKSMGSTCYVKCFILEALRKDSGFDAINFQSRTLDSIFKYKYNYIDLSRKDVNLTNGEHEVYSIPFILETNTYNLSYKIGQKTKLGLLEDFSAWGISSIQLKYCDINECYKLAVLLERFSKFLVNHSYAPFKKIVLSQKGFPAGWFYYNNLSDELDGDYDGMFQNYDVNKYSSKILTNIGANPDSKINISIPLGHLSNYENTFSPQRFIEQVMAFEYLYHKIYPSKNNFKLKNKLVEMFNEFSSILDAKQSADSIAEEIKELRRRITHGYEYYYTFENDANIMLNICNLDTLIKYMSLKVIGFDNQEINDYKAITF